MIIWKGIGIGLLFIAALFIWLTGFIIDSDVYSNELQFGVGLIIAGLFWLFTMKRKAAMEQKVMASGDEEKIAKFNKMKENPINDLDNSSLFFIPVKYWHYIMIAGGIAFIVAHFAK
jgi:hypothetical protein